MDEKTPEEVGRSMAEYILALSFAEDVLNLNKITLAMPIGSSFDDPVISIPIRRNDFDPDDPMQRERIDVDMEKVYEITIDEASAPFYHDIDDEFRHEYQQEFMKIMALAKVIQYLVEQPAKGKMDIEEFADKCIVDVGTGMYLALMPAWLRKRLLDPWRRRGY